MSIKKRLMSIFLCCVLTICCFTQVSASAEPVELEVTPEVEIVSVDVIPDGELGEVSPMAYGPTLGTPGTAVVSVTQSVNVGTVFYMKIPTGKKVNCFYMKGMCSVGYAAIATAMGACSNNYNARMNGNWYRISDKNLNYSGGQTIAITVVLSDDIRNYDITIVGS